MFEPMCGGEWLLLRETEQLTTLSGWRSLTNSVLVVFVSRSKLNHLDRAVYCVRSAPGQLNVLPGRVAAAAVDHLLK